MFGFIIQFYNSSVEWARKRIHKTMVNDPVANEKKKEQILDSKYIFFNVGCVQGASTTQPVAYSLTQHDYYIVYYILHYWSLFRLYDLDDESVRAYMYTVTIQYNSYH